MKQDFDFFKTIMPESRKADFYLGCLDSSVYIDFNKSDENLISLCRISFDGYGCCNLQDKTSYLSLELSNRFIEEMAKEELNQEIITTIVKELIKINREYIWEDALKEYELIDD